MINKLSTKLWIQGIDENRSFEKKNKGVMYYHSIPETKLNNVHV